MCCIPILQGGYIGDSVGEYDGGYTAAVNTSLSAAKTSITATGTTTNKPFQPKTQNPQTQNSVLLDP